MKKDKEKTINEKLEMAYINANRLDIFKIIQKLDKKRKTKKNKLIDSLGFEMGDLDEFDITEWKPRIKR